MNCTSFKYTPAISFLFWIQLISGAAAQTCPVDAAALTPAPLQEIWALEWWMPRHEQKLNEEGRESANILLVGDSITHSWESEGQEVWQQYFGHINTYNIGFSGDRTENVLWRFEHGEIDGINPKVAVVMIGTNNTGHRQDSPECTAKGVDMIIEQIKQKLPNTRILLLAIFPREATPEGELRQLNNRINEQIQRLNKEESVTYLNINDAFLDNDGNLSKDIMPDLLHPNEVGYKIWAEAIKTALLEILE